MSKPRFPILGTEIPPMLGRQDIMDQLRKDLTKKTPSHLSLVGPRFAGKSVILRALEELMLGSGTPYCAVIAWDLGHQTPRSDEEFIKLLTRRLGEGLLKAKPDLGEYLLQEGAGYDEVRDVIRSLNRSGHLVLMIWDGFDKPLGMGTLTRNLWDSLLDLCRTPSLRLVTSTRKELHKLIRDEKSVTSDFWGIFDGVVRITIFDDTDIDTILTLLPEFTFQLGAKTELRNWSGGFPPLLLEILNQIISSYGRGHVDNDMVHRAAHNASERLSALLATLWADCPARAQDLFAVLVERRELSFSEAGKEERTALVEKGFAEESGTKLRFTCRLLEKHIKGAGPDAGSMARLFGSWEDYCTNIRGLLERRLAHISPFDERLYRYVELSISHLPRDPELSLNSLTDIEERSLDLIWQREFGNDRTIPHEIIAYWTTSPRDRNKFIKGMMDETSWGVPSDRGPQLGLLQLLTGSQFGFESKAKVTSKDTYALVNAIHCYRNRTEHRDGQKIDVGIAVAALMTCLELLACLEKEART